MIKLLLARKMMVGSIGNIEGFDMYCFVGKIGLRIYTYTYIYIHIFGIENRFTYFCLTDSYTHIYIYIYMKQHKASQDETEYTS